ncbi:MAG: deoxyribodipyrimidine photo-lyase [Burkholderiales bacterium]|nr:MAG: deoxyribodipyrimidine photo-lyase [Burkholderiales bacterium]TAG82803.1 MAG: deoxyribodipyrimidine photo-lyase [Betaproteobacteria bacterium]
MTSSNVREFMLAPTRAARNAQVRELFPNLSGADCVMEGGRSAALRALGRVDPVAYARTRNHLDGKVTRLSPYFRHGVLTLAEAAEQGIKRSGFGAYKFVFELAWRDFWRRVWARDGKKIEQDLERAKVPLGDAPLPDDVKNANTELACMDGFVRDLVDTGYVHNHARMWFASYLVHHRKVSWKAAADWYYGELLDGDRASNHLSWQWVASTFSSKPYFFNRENLERYTEGRYCAQCPRARACPFDAPYPALEKKLFGKESFSR